MNTKNIYDENPKKILNIPVLYHVEDMERLTHIGDKDRSNAIDLYTAEDVIIYKGTRAMINCGISIDLPKNYKAELRPRSSTFKNFGLLQVNSIGLIDSSYSGANDVIMMPVYAPIQKSDLIQYMSNVLGLLWDNIINVKTCTCNCEKDDKNIDKTQILHKIFEQAEIETVPITIPKGTRLCQLEILPVMPDVNLIETKKEDWKALDRGGFGSTGK